VLSGFAAVPRVQEEIAARSATMSHHGTSYSSSERSRPCSSQRTAAVVTITMTTVPTAKGTSTGCPKPTQSAAAAAARSRTA